MIKWQYIGRRKLSAIIVLFVVAVCCAGVAELYLKPTLLKNEKTLRKTTSELNKTKTDTLEIEDELDFTREKKGDFELLELAGFFETQKRDIIQQSVDESMRLSGILGGSFKVSPPVCLVNGDLKDSQYVLLGSPVSIAAESYEDLSVYKFLDLFIRKLPGYVVVEDMQIGRTADVTRSLLQEIGTGVETPLVAADISMTWYTIVNKETAVCSEFRTR